jgi:hypothetical protein
VPIPVIDQPISQHDVQCSNASVFKYNCKKRKLRSLPSPPAAGGAAAAEASGARVPNVGVETLAVTPPAPKPLAPNNGVPPPAPNENEAATFFSALVSAQAILKDHGFRNMHRMPLLKIFHMNSVCLQHAGKYTIQCSWLISTFSKVWL